LRASRENKDAATALTEIALFRLMAACYASMRKKSKRAHNCT
jgi:hypothetical protein